MTIKYPIGKDLEMMSENQNNVSLIFDTKKDDPINYSWMHYCQYPEMKKHLKNIKNEHGQYDLVDERTGNIVMSASFPLSDYLE